MFAMYNPTAFGVGFVSFDVKFGEEARKFVKIRIPLCASETVVTAVVLLAPIITIYFCSQCESEMRYECLQIMTYFRFLFRM